MAAIAQAARTAGAIDADDIARFIAVKETMPMAEAMALLNRNGRILFIQNEPKT